jgi:hypothetical protein
MNEPRRHFSGPEKVAILKRHLLEKRKGCVVIDRDKAGNLWAALGVNHPILKAGQTKELRIEFSLVNDGDKAIDPKIAESHIVINGKQFTDPGSVFGKDAPFKALSPGDSLRFDWLSGITSRSQGYIRFIGKALVSNRRKSCSESFLKNPDDRVGSGGAKAVIENQSCWCEVEGGQVHYLVAHKIGVSSFF